ncbi:UDP-glucuronic acid decarboxylase 1-like isoform X2 [Amphibalanus amphitrite]|uniref:UDP-glucuronic acid decarboxylase 1-like isoform X2 n=1 Tax=Amphibalanus amphitrite TaxID=1232801 RepID=UPI001C9011F7|nr:UDP-glucuronic acid decarboxylase 1-like isoform X2 [Amphibalanus amphitrite]XP_043238546.1 UDP-glucuronic acid decarboxylase 1-like isoform X2 [Amphibalanus amphitrite]XP_043238547.1 UDP-glucuronic acid decarboxylase 1-like isoform X2 [Amphibalanus amphitrite]
MASVSKRATLRHRRIRQPQNAAGDLSRPLDAGDLQNHRQPADMVSYRAARRVFILTVCGAAIVTAVLVLGGHVLVGSTAVLAERSRNEARRASLRPPTPARPLPSSSELDCQSDALSHEEVQQCSTQLLHQYKAKLRALEKKLTAIELRAGSKFYPKVKFRSHGDRKRILITGGAGFVGSHLADRLMLEGHEVTVVDNLYTGRKRNVEQWLGHENFELFIHDIINTFYAEVDQIYHLASPASPPHYMANPVKTIKTNTMGTINMLGLAKRVGARILIASTSEVYGDPEVHPQPESYWGHVNPIGPRACYDEAKRVAETLAFAYQKQSNVSIGIARIFNTYGPRMHNNDGRVVSNFVLQALQNKTLTIYGSGEQTRSFQYVSDLVEGLVALMESGHTGPVNLGNPVEHTIEEFAHIIRQTVGGTSEVEYLDAVEDDPQKRKPDIRRAKELLNWEPKVPLSEGIPKTVEFFKNELSRKGHSERNRFDPLVDWSHITDGL